MRCGVDYIGIGVGAVIVNDEGQLFLARRGPEAKNERGLWEFPGGSVEFGETLAQALRREMYEEYGIEIKVGELLDVVDHILPDEGQHWVSPAFICTITSGKPIIRETAKCAEIGWFAPAEMPDDLTQITRVNLAHYKCRNLEGSSNMEEMQESVPELEITPNDRTWAALSWIPATPLWPILAIVALLMEETKSRPFVRYNAVLSIATGVILIPIAIVTCGLGALVYFVFFYWAYLVYQGEMVEVPVVSNWIRERGWV